jgi:hypothetical protein
MTGPGFPHDPTDAATFEHDDEENLDPMADDAEQDQDDGAYGADDDWPADVCHPLYDGG